MTDKHLTLEEIEEILSKHKSLHPSRRDILISGAKLLGGLYLGASILSNTKDALADVNWNNDMTSRPKGPKPEYMTAEPPKGKSKIVQVTNANSVDSSGTGKQGPAVDMLKKGILELTGEKDPASGWRTIAKQGDRVGIKVNCISGFGLSTQVPLVMAIVECLKFAGVREKDIIIWDRTDRELRNAGYTLSEGTDSLRCFGTKKYEDKINNINGTQFRLSTILLDDIDVLINAPIMKDHGGAGVTLSIKNHYGAHNNPSDHHRNGCDPDAPNICLHDAIRSKTKLIVLDALKAQCKGGPGNKPRYQWYPGMILMGQDLVAIDRTGSDIIEARLHEINAGTLGNSHHHIATAGKLGIGNDDRSKIDVKKVVVK